MIATEFVIEVENTPGQLAKVARTLGKEGINIKAITTERIGKQGYIRILVDNEEKTKKVLEDGDFLYTEGEVLVKAFDDKPNALAEVADALAKEGVNIEAIYLGTFHQGKVNVVFVLDDISAGRRILGD